MTSTLPNWPKLHQRKAEMTKTFKLYWAPEGRCIGVVQAKTPIDAIRKAPMPYRRYLGEIYAIKENQDD